MLQIKPPHSKNESNTNHHTIGKQIGDNLLNNDLIFAEVEITKPQDFVAGGFSHCDITKILYCTICVLKTNKGQKNYKKFRKMVSHYFGNGTTSLDPDAYIESGKQMAYKTYCNYVMLIQKLDKLSDQEQTRFLNKMQEFYNKQVKYKKGSNWIEFMLEVFEELSETN